MLRNLSSARAASRPQDHFETLQHVSQTEIYICIQSYTYNIKKYKYTYAYKCTGSALSRRTESLPSANNTNQIVLFCKPSVPDSQHIYSRAHLCRQKGYGCYFQMFCNPLRFSEVSRPPGQMYKYPQISKTEFPDGEKGDIFNEIAVQQIVSIIQTDQMQRLM